MEIIFPGWPAEVQFHRDRLCFGAIADGRHISCYVSFEWLVGIKSISLKAAEEAFEARQDEAQECARKLIEAGQVEHGEVTIKTGMCLP